MPQIWSGIWVCWWPDAILDKLNSLYSLVSTFKIMMQGFYRESLGRSESITHCMARMKFVLNIWIGFLRQKPLGTLGIVYSTALGNPSNRWSMPRLTTPWTFKWFWCKQLEKLRVNMNSRSLITPVLPSLA